MNLALPNPSGPVLVLSPAGQAEALRASRESPRRRMVLPLHRRQGDPVQRLVNFLQPGTYVRPHRHPRPGASETILVLSGELGFAVFEPDGGLRSLHRLGAGDLVDIEAGVWHALAALAADTSVLEIKLGPFDEGDKEFATWAPAENSAEAPAYLAGLTASLEEAPAPRG